MSDRVKSSKITAKINNNNCLSKNIAKFQNIYSVTDGPKY